MSASQLAAMLAAMTVDEMVETKVSLTVGY
jgi:hypothetical protein